MSVIFISYRRKDSAGYAWGLRTSLLRYFDVNQIFYDIGSIESGTSFPEEIEKGLTSSRVFLIAIAPEWSSEENIQRLHEVTDYVRHEVGSAFARHESEQINPPLVIPVLLGGAVLPGKNTIPEVLQRIVTLETHEIQGDAETQDRQVEALCEKIITYCPQDWVSRQNDWVSEGLRDKDQSFHHFRQDLSVMGKGTKLIHRKAAVEALENWWTSWHEHRHPFGMLGGEGDGKSWAVGSWIASRLASLRLPVIYLPASGFEHADLVEVQHMLASTLANSLGMGTEKLWKERLQFLKASKNVPVLLLIVDGLNERPSLDWRLFLSTSLSILAQDGIAVLFTCRSVYWQQHLSAEFERRTVSLRLPPFNDDELDQALNAAGSDRNSYSENLLKLMAKPRYFDMALRLQDRFEKEGDITVDRLIYEDWRDRISRKRGRTPPMRHEEFNGFIADVVSRQGEQISRRDVMEGLSFLGDVAATYSDLTSSGILNEKNGRLLISENALILGFGLVLAEAVAECREATGVEVDEVIASFSGDHPDIDRLVQITAMALCHAMLTEDFPETGRIALFRAWVGGRNLTDVDVERILGYLPLRPKTYFAMAEHYWGKKFNHREVQNVLVAAFLKYRTIPKVRAEMVEAFGRWLGFIYIYGYRGFFEREQEKAADLRRDLEGRLGQSAEPGPLELAGYQSSVVSDANLLRLGQVAVAIISHGDHMAFMTPLVKGLIASSVMEGSHAEFAWVLHTANPPFQRVLTEEAQKLIDLKTAVAFRAAYKILSSLYTETALLLRETIPQEFQWKHPIVEELKAEDECNSSWVAWNEEKFRACMERTSLASIAIAVKLHDIAINPAMGLSEGLAARLDDTLGYIEFAHVRSNIGMTREDYDLQKIEPALCAYRPSDYVRLAKSLVNLLPERDEEQRRLLGFAIWKHLPVLQDDDHQQLLSAWRSSRALDSGEQNLTETILFALTVFDLPGLAQLELVIERGWNGTYFTDNPPIFRRFQEADLPSVDERIDGLDEAGIKAVLWYLSFALPALTEVMRKKLLLLFEAGDTVIRGYCLEIFSRTADSLAAATVIRGGWSYSTQEVCPLEADWGSILLCEFGFDIPYIELITRIKPEHAGYALKRRGMKKEELLKYAHLLHLIWSHIALPEIDSENLLRHVRIRVREKEELPLQDWTVDVDEDQPVKLENYTWGGFAGNVSIDRVKRAFDPTVAEAEWRAVHQQVLDFFKAESKRGNHWTNLSFSYGNLNEVVACSPEFWRQWVEPVLQRNNNGLRLLAFCQGFYEKLCKELLDYEPETGVALFNIILERNLTKILDSDTGIRLLFSDLFQAQPSDPIKKEWGKLLEEAVSDNDLFEITLLAQESEGAAAWLGQEIQKLLNSDADFDNARGLQLCGFSSFLSDGDLIRAWMTNRHSSWVKNLAKNSLRNHDKNRWANEWFRKFLAEPDRVRAWTSFRLFLQCVDRRYWTWNNGLVSEIMLPDWKADALAGNSRAIRDSAKENEKKLKEKFLGHDIKQNQLWPWMQRYQ